MLKEDSTNQEELMQRKIVLFCKNPYAFGILKPLAEEGVARGYRLLWYLTPELEPIFPVKDQSYTTSIEDVMKFQCDALLVPGNEVPHFLRGVKTQIFHGFAGEKKGHFRIRGYFDLYLTQGPYFTERFHELREKHMNFHVIETGWSKLDPLYHGELDKFSGDKQSYLDDHGAKKIVLYAPTFSPSLASAKYLQNQINVIAERPDTLVLVKFHDLMDISVVSKYEKLAKQIKNLVIIDDRNILKYLVISDVLISDTSSAIYEFILLNKPVITLRTNSSLKNWIDVDKPEDVITAYEELLVEDTYSNKRQEIIDQYHPYNDGQSSGRVYDAIDEYIAAYGIPNGRTIEWYRQVKMKQMFK
jgi:hypothetical protein